MNPIILTKSKMEDIIYNDLPKHLNLPLPIHREWCGVLNSDATTLDKIVWVYNHAAVLTFQEYSSIMEALIMYRCLEEDVNDANMFRIELESCWLYFDSINKYLDCKTD